MGLRTKDRRRMNTLSFMLGSFVGATTIVIALIAFLAWATHGDW